MLLELKTKLVVKRTKKICVRGRKDENGESCFSGESGEHEVKS